VVENLEQPLQNYLTVLGQLEPRIQAHLKPTSDGGTKISSRDWKWYFQKKDIGDFKGRLEATKATLDAALTFVIL